MYGEHFIWRFENLLGRTMWEFAGTDDAPKFLVVARTVLEPAPPRNLPHALREQLILYGALGDLDNGEPTGVALALEAGSAEGLLEAAGLEDDEAEIHRWDFGGRR